MYQLAFRILILFIFLLVPKTALSYQLAGAGGSFGVDIDRTSREVRGKITEQVVKRSILKNRIYYSFTIIGDQSTLNAALNDKGVPLNVTIWCDDERRDTFFIGITQNGIQSNENKLQNEVDQMGIFTWRTHFNTQKIGCEKLDFIIDGPDGTLKTVGGASNFTPSIRIVK